MTTHVFLGPSLPLAEARAILPAAVFHPPVAMGHVYRLIEHAPSVIAIVDGLFEQVPSVWHKEILYALESGVLVFGASSMGALRAAELHPFGMRGVGCVFERFASGELEDDDEVAVAHAAAESGYRVMSVAMVNIREGLARAEARALVSAGERQILVDAAKAQFYPDRSWRALQALGAAHGVDPARLATLVDYLERENVDLKARDARTLLEHLAHLSDEPSLPRPAFTLERTKFWFQMVDRTAPVMAVDDEGTNTAPDITLESLWEHVRLVDGGGAIERAILLNFLASREGRQSGFEPDVQSVQAAARRILRERGCPSPDAIESWLAAQGMTDQDLVQASCDDTLIERLWNQYESQLLPLLPLELKRRGRFAEIVDLVQRKNRLLRERGLKDPSLDDASIDADSLLAWYAGRFRPVSGSVEGHARELGFATSRDFLSAALTQYLFEQSATDSGGVVASRGVVI